jgi:Mrp family chromosome partitioning ATPase
MRANAAHQEIVTEPFSAYAEMIRAATVRSELAGPGGGGKVVIVTSSAPKEGKTTLALSVAAYLGMCRRRVVFVDLAVRERPLFDQRGDTAGARVPEFQQGDRLSAGLMRHITGFDYLPFLQMRPEPEGLSDRDRITNLVARLRQSYDCVLIDGLTTAAIAEMTSLPTIVDIILLVIKWGETKRDVVQKMSRLLCDLGYQKKNNACINAIVVQANATRMASR